MTVSVLQSEGRRRARLVLAAAATTVAASLLLHAAAAALDQPRLRVLASAVGGVLAGLCATLASWNAGAAASDAALRRTWRLLGLGSASWLVAQLLWSYTVVVRRATPPYPSVADALFLAVYPFAIWAVATLYRRSQLQLSREVALDAFLLTMAVGIQGYFLLLRPFLADRPESAAATLIALLGQLGAVGLVWMLLMFLLQHGEGLTTRAGRVLVAGLGANGAGDFVYSALATSGAYAPGHVIDLAFIVGFTCVATAAALEVLEEPGLPRARVSHRPVWPRVLPVALGLVTFSTVGVYLVLSGTPALGAARLLLGLFIVWAGLVVVRVGFALAADRRYAERLEREVATQTVSLMDSLAATAAAERQLRLLMEAVPDAITALDRDGRILDLNAAAARMTASPKAEPGRSVFEFLAPEHAALVRANLEAAFGGETRRFEVPFRRDDGSHGMTAVVYAPVREGPRVARVLALARDITDQRRMEIQLAQADKLAALGQLVSGVAHEINNPAATISGFAQTLLLEPLDPERRDIIQIINEEAVRIGQITRNLLAFARATRAERVLVDLNEIVRRTYALRAYHLSTLEIQAKLDLEEPAPTSWGDISQIQQVLLNLLINAEQALGATTGPGTGTGTGPRVITLQTRLDDSDAVFTIADTGPGVPPELQRKIFDPFFTTKAEGEGSGLGLSIAYGIVRHHGGRIWVESQPGEGAAFHVALPIEPRRETRPIRPRLTPAGEPQRFSVLVIDDEQGMRNALLRYLTRRGHHSVGAADDAAGLELLARDAFDAIVVDAHLPGLNGAEFVAAVRTTRPTLAGRVIFATADTCPESVARTIREHGLKAIAKPFDFEDLERAIAAALQE